MLQEKCKYAMWTKFSVCNVTAVGTCNNGAVSVQYRVTQNDWRGFNNLSYTIHLRQEYVVAPMDQEILRVFFYDVRCAVVMHFSAWIAVY